MSTDKIQKGSIVLYHVKDGKTELKVKLENETVWLTLDQMSTLFGRDKSVISRHIKNVFSEHELDRKSVVANFATTATDGKVYQVDYYNLDVIISVGYRVNSLQGTNFRIWSNSVLKDHIIKGYTLNQKRLQEKGLTEFEQAIALIKKTVENKSLSGDESKGLLDVITTYASTWLLLQKYDKSELTTPKTKRAYKKLDYQFCRSAIDQLKSELMRKKETTEIFGNERSEQFQGIIGNIYQTFDRHELYPSIEEKAAHLLYFVIKDHPFTDGNKRIGSFLFIVFLAKNSYLYRKNGEKKISDNALTALALLVAESPPSQKTLMIALIMNFISE